MMHQHEEHMVTLKLCLGWRPHVWVLGMGHKEGNGYGVIWLNRSVLPATSTRLRPLRLGW
jgi:hypothetical protein